MAQVFLGGGSAVRAEKSDRKHVDKEHLPVLHRRAPDDPMRLLPNVLRSLDHSFSIHHQTYLSGQRGLLAQAAEAVLSGEPGVVTAVPFQPGLGKSTLIRALLETFAVEFLFGTAIAKRIGGVIVVVEKTAEAEELAALCNQFCLGGELLAQAISSPNDYNLRQGRCPTGEAFSYQECLRRSCPSYGECPLIQSVHKAHETPILIMLHARYHRYMEDMSDFLVWTDADGAEHPRTILLIDELPGLLEENVLDLHTITQAEEALSLLKPSYQPGIRKEKASLLSMWNWKVRIPFLNLLRMLSPLKENCGLITWASLEQAGFQRDALQALDKKLCAYIQSERHDALSIVRTLLTCSNLFYSAGQNVSLFLPRLRKLSGKGQPATFVFSGTAPLSPELSQNPEVHVLPDQTLESFQRLHLHIQRGDQFNISKTGLSHPKNQAGLLEWVRAMLPQLRERHQKILAVTYKEHAAAFWQALPKAHDLLVPYLRDDGAPQEMLPYFGGMNGSNRYQECTCVLVLGLNRFEPRDYISRALALDDSGALNQAFLSALEEGRMPPPLAASPAVMRIQDAALACDIVQLIFRSALRRHGETREIELWLLQPPNGVVQFLQDYFVDCSIQEHKELPEACSLAVAANRAYLGQQTHAAKLLQVLTRLKAGSRVTPAEIRTATGLTVPQFKEAKKNKEVQAYFRKYMETRGSGQHTVYCKKAVNGSDAPAGHPKQEELRPGF